LKFLRLDEKVIAMYWCQWRVCWIKIIFLYLCISANHSLWRCHNPGWTLCVLQPKVVSGEHMYLEPRGTWPVSPRVWWSRPLSGRQPA
jgi:hypothetical protein